MIILEILGLIALGTVGVAAISGIGYGITLIVEGLGKTASAAEKGVGKLKQKINDEKDKNKKNTKTQNLGQSITKSTDLSKIRFVSTKDGDSTFVDYSVSIPQDISPSNSMIFKGKIKTTDEAGVVSTKDGYFYLPNLYVGKKKAVVSPRKTKDGHLEDKFPYYIKVGDKTYYAPIPMAECASGLQFDFLNSSIHGPKRNKPDASKPALCDFIDLDIPQDKDGNYIPVDFNKPEEKAAYDAYMKAKIEQETKEKGSVLKEFKEVIFKGMRALTKKTKADASVTSSYQDTDIPVNATSIPSRPDVQRVTGSRPAQNAYAGYYSYYDQFSPIPQGSNYGRMGLYGMNGRYGSNGNAYFAGNQNGNYWHDYYSYYDQFAPIPEGSNYARGGQGGPGGPGGFGPGGPGGMPPQGMDPGSMPPPPGDGGRHL